MKDEIRYPEDVAKLKQAMFEAGFVRTDFAVQSLYEDFSEDEYAAGWMSLTPEIVKCFISWFNEDL